MLGLPSFAISPVATVALRVVGLLILVGLLVGAILGVQHLLSGSQNAAVKEETKAGTATVAAGQSNAAQAAQQIEITGGARDRVDLEVHQTNDQAIAAAPGASATIDPRLVAVGITGLCHHPAYAADPRCVGLLSNHPAELPQAGSSNPAAPQ